MRLKIPIHLYCYISYRTKHLSSKSCHMFFQEIRKVNSPHIWSNVICQFLLLFAGYEQFLLSVHCYWTVPEEERGFRRRYRKEVVPPECRGQSEIGAFCIYRELIHWYGWQFWWNDLSSFWKGVYSKRKEFAPHGNKFFPFRVDHISEWAWFAGKQSGSPKICLPCE